MARVCDENKIMQSKAIGKITATYERANEFVAVAVIRGKCIQNRMKQVSKRASKNGSLTVNLISYSLIVRLGATIRKQINIYLI